jgi:hypothetical protein
VRGPSIFLRAAGILRRCRRRPTALATPSHCYRRLRSKAIRGRAWKRRQPWCITGQSWPAAHQQFYSRRRDIHQFELTQPPRQRRVHQGARPKLAANCGCNANVQQRRLQRMSASGAANEAKSAIPQTMKPSRAKAHFDGDCAHLRGAHGSSTRSARSASSPRATHVLGRQDLQQRRDGHNRLDGRGQTHLSAVAVAVNAMRSAGADCRRRRSPPAAAPLT